MKRGEERLFLNIVFAAFPHKCVATGLWPVQLSVTSKQTAHRAVATVS